MTDRVLVTGGAGYIGSHACKALRRAGFEPVAFDNLNTGWAEAVKFGPFVKGDLMDRPAIDAALAEWQPVAVMHFAALSLVGESMKDPAKYWRVNVNGALNLVEATVAAGIRNFVFSSTCATFGDQDGVVLDEDTPQKPINAYGASKKAIEDILFNFRDAFGLNHVIFRYFNVAGADPEGEVGEQHVPETHLIPILLEAIEGKRPALTVFGTDYPTADGTGVRDYIHVEDLASAHLDALDYLRKGGESITLNAGYGHGYSVREVLDMVGKVNGKPLTIIEEGRRAGDPAALIATAGKIRKVLGWEPKYDNLEEIVRSALAWERKLAEKRG